MENIKYIYLIEKSILGRDNKIKKRLKVGKTKKEFRKGRLGVYESNCSPEDISLIKVIKAPEILEDMFHIRFNSYRVIKERTGRKSEWMRWNDEAKNLFLSENLFENLCDFLWNNKEEYLSGKNNLVVKKKIINFLEKRNRLKINELFKNIPKTTNNSMKFILAKNLKCGLNLIRSDYEEFNNIS